MKSLQPTSTHPAQHSVYISPALSKCTHVFIHYDATRRPLQQPYNSPYKVLKQEDKHFVIDINGRHDSVSLDWLKAAHSKYRLPIQGIAPDQCISSTPSSPPPSSPLPCDSPYASFYWLFKDHALRMPRPLAQTPLEFRSLIRSLGGELCGGHISFLPNSLIYAFVLFHILPHHVM